MKVTQILALAAVALLAQGCISFDMGPECSIPDADAKSQVSVQSVDGIVPKISFVSLSSVGAKYKLELVANGIFIRHDGHTMNKGTPCLSVGLWPGLAGAENKVELAFFSILGIYPYCCFPTVVSLLFEPFRDYRVKPASGVGDVADVGLIGVNKYYRNVHKDTSAAFVSTSTEKLTSYRLFGFAVEIDGVAYEDKDLGSGCPGYVYFTSSRPRGSRISIRITDPPAWRSDGADGFAELRGAVLTGYLP